jgi:2-amino-4-hydroxy-6-hydroxymethyldihydropteridine diphosphokinase
MDIIAYDDLVLQTDTLIIPHENYAERLFVLLPLRDVAPQWLDPNTKTTIYTLIEQAPPMRITQTNLNW